MALRRRSTGDSFRMGIWPGFVDAMTAMLLVFTFVLSIFMMTQYFLRETIEGQEEEIVDKESALSSLTSRLDSLSDLLSLERNERAEAEAQAGQLRASLATVSNEKTETERRLEALAAQLSATETERDAERAAVLREVAERRALEALASTLRTDLATTEAVLGDTSLLLDEEQKARALEIAAAEALRKRLTESRTELTAMELALDEQRAKAEETLLMLAAAREAEGKLSEALKTTSAGLEEKDVMLALAKSELATLGEASAEEQKQLALLNEQTRALREQLSAISAELEISEQARTKALGESDRQGAVIASLGERLNTALAEKNRALEEKRALLEEQVDELSAFRSEFFGRVRAALAGRDDIVIKGDRFVFQSEVLFGPGSANLNEDGIREMGRFAEILTDISDDIPADVDWILRIDGHTDRRPLTPGRTPFADNWELSQARALSVARYLIQDHGIEPRRLAPTGFGEFQPLNRATSAEAYAQNRRIELKLTER